MQYRITVKDDAKPGIELLEVEAEDVYSAIFAAGMMMAHNRNPVGKVQVVSVAASTWVEVKL